MISKNTSASTLHFKKQISPNTERIKTNPFSPFLNEKRGSVNIPSIEMTLNNNTKKGSFVNNDVVFSKLQEENKKCIDFTSKIIESISKLKSFLSISGKHYNNFFDKIKNTESSSIDNFDKLNDYIDVIHEGALELKYSFNTLTTVDDNDDITFDSTKINKNNIKLSSERRLNIYKKLFDICKHSLIEITDILMNLLSMQEFSLENERDQNNKTNFLYDKLETNLQPINTSITKLASVHYSTEPSTKRSERTLCVVIEENIDKGIEQNVLGLNQIKKSFNEDFDTGEEEHTTINENVNILHIPSTIMNVNKPKDIDVKFRTFGLYKNEDLIELESITQNNLNEEKNLDDSDTIKQYESFSVTMKTHRKIRSLDVNCCKTSKRNR
jgi:hypothetical protein